MMEEDLRELPQVLEVRVPLRSRIFTLTLLLTVSILSLYFITELPKYGVLLGKDILGVKAKFLQIRLTKDVMSYPLYALAGASFIYFLYLSLYLKMLLYKLNHLNLIYKHGVLTTKEDPMDLVAIRDQAESRNIMQRMLGLSTVKIISTDTTHPELEIKGIDKEDAKKLAIFINQHAFRSYTEYRVKKDLNRDLKNGKGRKEKDDNYIYGDDGGE